MAVILLPINTSGSSPGKQCPSLLMYDYLMKQVGAYDILGTATSATSAAHVTETI